MKMRTAILAACAGTLALAHADAAWANIACALESESYARSTDIGSEPVIVVAQNALTATQNTAAQPLTKQGKSGSGTAKGNGSGSQLPSAYYGRGADVGTLTSSKAPADPKKTKNNKTDNLLYPIDVK